MWRRRRPRPVTCLDVPPHARIPHLKLPAHAPANGLIDAIRMTDLSPYIVRSLKPSKGFISSSSLLRNSPARARHLPGSPAGRIVRLVATFTKILAATDFSDDSNYALEYAEELARRFSAEILVMHVDQPLSPVIVSDLSPGLDVGAMNRIAEEQRLMALRELDRITARLRDAGLKSRSLLKVGAPFLEIVTAAHSDSADLIVLGTHGRSGLAHVLMGSVAERVVRKAHCPVLTIRHPDRKFKHPLDKPDKSDK
jgi:nucleotide-binding universal stress UspA family protein